MQIITQILNILSEIILNYFESLRTNVVSQVVTAIWLIIGGTWKEKRVALQQNIGTLLTHPIHYDPKEEGAKKEAPSIWYPFDAFQVMRNGFNWFASQIESLSNPVWSKLNNGMITEGFPEKILLGLTLLGFFYADIVIGFAIAYEQDLITEIPMIFQFYGIAIAFATIGSAFASGLLGYEILREGAPIWKRKGIKVIGLIFVTILFILSIVTAIGINAKFILADSELDPIIVNYVNLVSDVSMQVLTRVNSLLATLLLPFGAAFEGLLFVIAFLLSALSVSIRVIGVVVSVGLDLVFRFSVVFVELIAFLVISAPERIITAVTNRTNKNTVTPLD